MREVTREAWSSFITRYKYICCGSGNDQMWVYDIPSRQAIGLVEYFSNGAVKYYIAPETKAEVSYVYPR
jgi:hypothetical protein